MSYVDRYSYQDKVELAKACLVGMCANFEAPHHKPRELAAKALDVASAFYDELDAREAANEAKEEEAGTTEPPPSSLLSPLRASDEIDEDPPESVNELVTAPPQRTWSDLAREQ